MPTARHRWIRPVRNYGRLEFLAISRLGLDQRTRSARLGTSSAEGNVPSRQRRRAYGARFVFGGFICNIRHMSAAAGDDFKLHLARAFDRAWKRYYRPSRIGVISEHVARAALAKYLIALAKEGVVSMDALAQGGFIHLISLTPEAQHWGHLKIEGAKARFQPLWRIRHRQD
jgi:hypothetical protein